MANPVAAAPHANAPLLIEREIIEDLAQEVQDHLELDERIRVAVDQIIKLYSGWLQVFALFSPLITGIVVTCVALLAVKGSWTVYFFCLATTFGIALASDYLASRIISSANPQ